MTREHLETGAEWFGMSLAYLYGLFMWLAGAMLFGWVFKPANETGFLLSLGVGAVLWWLMLSVIAWFSDLRLEAELAQESRQQAVEEARKSEEQRRQESVKQALEEELRKAREKWRAACERNRVASEWARVEWDRAAETYSWRNNLALDDAARERRETSDEWRATLHSYMRLRQEFGERYGRVGSRGEVAVNRRA